MRRSPALRLPFALWAIAMITTTAACSGEAPPVSDAAVRDSTHRVIAVTGFDGPEAVRYDSIGDSWFVANFAGEAEGDANGFISRVTAEGVIDSLRFMTGTTAAPLHGPRGMYLQGDTLWVADALGVHGFHRTTGRQVAFHDFSAHGPGFLNDVAAGADGTLYITDTGASRIYRVAQGIITVAVDADNGLGALNGITRDGTTGRFLVAGWGAEGKVRSWDPASGEITDVGTATTGRFDGVEVVGGRVIVASQADSSLHAIEGGLERVVIRTPGAPADIGVDTRRGRVAVPYIALDRIDIWDLPPAR
jgi:hypothetical protein